MGSKDGSWEELACESLCSGTPSSTKFSLNSCSHFGTSEFNKSLRSISWFSFLFGLGFLVGLVNSCSSEVSEEHGSPRSCHSTCLFDTAAGKWSVPHASPRALFSLSLDTVADVVVGEVDELEEDVGWSISCLEGVMDVEEGKLEEELVDKPGTTIGTKFSVLQIIRIPSLMRFLDHWSIRKEYPFSSQSFPSDKTAGVFSRTFRVKNVSNSLT